MSEVHELHRLGEVLLVHLGNWKSRSLRAGGFTPEGLPVGVQIVGRDKQDFSVLKMAHAFEPATGFGKKRPPVVS